jgi:hypothetical protein
MWRLAFEDHSARNRPSSWKINARQDRVCIEKCIDALLSFEVQTQGGLVKAEVDFSGALSKSEKKEHLKKKNLLRRIMRLEAQVGTLLSKLERLEDSHREIRISALEENRKIR